MIHLVEQGLIQWTNTLVFPTGDFVEYVCTTHQLINYQLHVPSCS